MFVYLDGVFRRSATEPHVNQGLHKQLIILVCISQLRTEAYIYTLSLLTDRKHICPHNFPTNLTTVEKLYSKITLPKFQAASHLANAPWRQQPGNSLEEYLVDNNKLKTINL